MASDEQEIRKQEVLHGLSLGRGKSAKEIQRIILDVYAARGWEPPTDFSRISRFLAAATARRWRKARILFEAARGLRAAQKRIDEIWVGDPPESDV